MFFIKVIDLIKAYIGPFAFGQFGIQCITKRKKSPCILDLVGTLSSSPLLIIIRSWGCS